MSLQYLKEEVWDKLIFCMQNVKVWFQHFGHQGFVQSYTNIIDSHSQSTQSKKVALSLQYHKIELGMEFIFSNADKHQSFYKLALSFFMEVARHV